MTSTAASSRDTAASMVVGCRSVTSFTWPPSVQAVTVPPSKPFTIASSPPTKNPRSSSWPSCEKRSQPSTLCSAIVLHGSHDPPEPTTQLLIRQRQTSVLTLGVVEREPRDQLGGDLFHVCLSETHTRMYRWCSPPKTGTANV